MSKICWNLINEEKKTKIYVPNSVYLGGIVAWQSFIVASHIRLFLEEKALIPVNLQMKGNVDLEKN